MSGEMKIPEGWKLVPVEPTPEMLLRGYCAIPAYDACKEDARECWSAMLAASPPPPEDGWMEIESAPKDGTHILLANQSGTSQGGWLSDVDHGAEWEGQLHMAGWWRTDGTDWPNTHWMPIPKAPPPPAALEPKEQHE